MEISQAILDDLTAKAKASCQGTGTWHEPAKRLGEAENEFGSQGFCN